MESTPAGGRLGVISPLPEELAHLSDTSEPPVRIGGLPFWRGSIAARPAVFVECGVGKVNAAIAATLLLDRFHCTALMMSGVAGGLDPALGVGDVIVSTLNLQHDYGAESEDGFLHYQPGALPLPGVDRTSGYPMAAALRDKLSAGLAGLKLDPLPESLGAGRRHPVIRLGSILSGDRFVNAERTRQRLHTTHTAHAVEMEGGAVAQVAWQSGGIPFVNVRCLSDLAGSSSHLDFQAFLPVAARYASQVVHRLAPLL